MKLLDPEIKAIIFLSVVYTQTVVCTVDVRERESRMAVDVCVCVRESRTVVWGQEEDVVQRRCDCLDLSE